MSIKTNKIENLTPKEQKQDTHCQTENIFCPIFKNKRDMSEVKEKFLPLHNFLQGTNKISHNLIKNVAQLLSADDKLVENAKCIGFYDRNTCKTLNFFHPVVYINIFHGIKDFNKFEENDDYLKAVGDYLDSIYVPLTELLTIFERDINNYEIHLIPKEGVKGKVVKHFENVEYEVEEHIFEYVMKLYDLIIEVENKSFDKERDSVYKEQILEALSKNCEFISSKISYNEHLNGIFSCSKIVPIEKKAQENLLNQGTKEENTSYLPHLEDKAHLGGNNLTSIGSESRHQTPLSTEIIVICVSFGISLIIFLLICFVYNYFMKKRVLKERRQQSDRIELVEDFDTDQISLN